MTIQQQVALATQSYAKLTGRNLADVKGKWHVITSLYGKESVMDTENTLEDALRLGETNHLFLCVELRGAQTIRFEPGAPRTVALTIKVN